MHSEKGNENCEGSVSQILQVVTKGTEIVQCGEEEAQGRSYSSLQLPEGRLWRGGSQPLVLCK